MNKMNRREFLKLATATGASAAMMGGLSDGVIFPEALAKADANAPEEVRYSHCQMCNSGPKCGVRAVIKDNYIIRLEKRQNYTNNRLCSKGCASIQDLYHPDRLLYPMKRTNPKGEPGQWERISWDEAIATIVEKINGIKEKYGADKVLFSTGDPKEPRAAVQRLAYTFGSANYGTESSTCQQATVVAANLLYGSNTANTGSDPTGGKTKVAMLWGTNNAWAMPATFENWRKAKAAGTKFIVIDPRITPTAINLADIHLQIRPGTDAALALCFGNAYIQNDAYDHEFVENYTHGFEDYKALCAQYTVEKTAEICCIPVEKLQAAVDLLMAERAPITTKFASSFPHHVNGVNTCRAINCLIPLSGSLDVVGGARIAVDSLNTDNKFSLAGSKQPELDAMRVDRKYFPVWAELVKEIQLNKLPEYVRDGELRAAVMFGQNAMMWPQTSEYQKAFKDMEFVVTADYYIFPWTHDYVDMLLPAAMSYERSCPLTVSGRKVILREAIVKPQGEARPDWRICCDIGTALGYKDEFFGGGEDAEDNCIRECLKGFNRGITLEDLRAAGPDGITIPAPENPEKKYASGDFKFKTPSGKFEFASEVLKKHGFEPLPVFVEPTESPVSTPELAKEYPLILNSGSRVPMYTHSKQRNIPWLRALMPDPIVRLYPTDAEARGIAQGDDVVLCSPHGKITVKAEVTNLVKPGCIDIFHGWEKANVNSIHPRDFDPISGFPSYKEGLCDVRKV